MIPRMKVGEAGSFIVTKDICGQLGMTEREVLQDAKANMERQKFICRDLTEVVQEIMEEYHMPKSYIDETLYMQSPPFPMYMLTNEAKCDGAAMIVSDRAMMQARELIGEDFYIIPSSRHEVLLLPSSEIPSVGDLKALVQQVNTETVSKDDWLSNEVYRYDDLTQRITLADKKAKLEEKTDKRTKIKGR